MVKAKKVSYRKSTKQLGGKVWFKRLPFKFSILSVTILGCLTLVALGAYHFAPRDDSQTDVLAAKSNDANADSSNPAENHPTKTLTIVINTQDGKTHNLNDGILYCVYGPSSASNTNSRHTATVSNSSLCVSQLPVKAQITYAVSDTIGTYLPVQYGYKTTKPQFASARCNAPKGTQMPTCIISAATPNTLTTLVPLTPVPIVIKPRVTPKLTPYSGIQPPTGYISARSNFCSQGISGWACVTDKLNVPVSVDLYMDGSYWNHGRFLERITANSGSLKIPTSSICRRGSINHGFVFSLSDPKLKPLFDGKKHTIYVHAIGGWNPTLNNSGQTFSCKK